MEFLRPSNVRPSSIGVRHSGEIFEAVVTPFPLDGGDLLAGGFDAQASEIFDQFAQVLTEAGLEKTDVTTARIYLHNVDADAASMNKHWKAFFGDHPPCRLCIGANLQSGMLIEISFVAEVPAP